MFSIYRHSSHPKALEEAQNLARYKKHLIEQDKHYILTKNKKTRIIARALLDSSLITTTTNQLYNAKVIDCNKTVQVYLIEDYALKKKRNYEKIKDSRVEELDTDFLFKKNNIKRKNELQVIEYKNIMRSKFEMQRLVKANEDEFKSFITLTFAKNVKDIKETNRIFKNWRDTVSRYLKKKNQEFKYVCVPEFQKRGAVHYHLLTNQEINHSDIIIPQQNNSTCYDVKYWRHGFSSVFNLDTFDVVAYLTKYMTKDIDNRLFQHRRYFYSTNLKKPETVYYNLSYVDELFKYLVNVDNKEVVFSNTYLDVLGHEVTFLEFKKIE